MTSADFYSHHRNRDFSMRGFTLFICAILLPGFFGFGGISESFAKKPETDYELFAEALEQRDSEKAVQFLYKIVDRHRQLRQHSQAISFCRELLEKTDEKDALLRVSILEHLGILHWEQYQLDTALYYFMEEQQLLEEKGDPLLLAACYNNMAAVYYSSGNYEASINYYKKARTVYILVKDWEKEAFCLYNLGLTRKSQGFYTLSLRYYLDALRLFQKNKQAVPIASCKNAIGNVYYRLNQPEQALKFHTEALELRQQLGDTSGMAESLNNIGNTYRINAEYEKALDAYKKALELKEEGEARKSMASTFINIAAVYHKQKQASKAIRYYQRALELKKKMGDRKGIAIAGNGLAVVYLAEARYAKARVYLDTSLRLARTIGVRELIKENYEIRSDLYTLQQMPEEALYYYKAYHAIKDTLLNEQKNKAIAEMQIRYETEKTTQELLIEKHKVGRQRIFLTTLSGGLLSLLIIASLLYNRFRIKRKANRLLQKQKQQIEHLYKELNHRVKNNMETLSSLFNLQYLQLKDQGAKALVTQARNRMQAMAILHKELYQNEEVHTVQMQQYLENLVDNLLDSYGYSREAVHIAWHVQDLDFDLGTAKYLGLITNELVSNALKYAFQSGADPYLYIALYDYSDRDYCLEVKDNGPGLPENFNFEKTASFGLRLVATLSKQLRATIRFYTEKGACFQLCFPKKKRS